MSATLAEPTAVPADVSVWPRYPTLYEIDTWVWLSELKQKYGKNLDLSSRPSTEWDAIAAFGLDAVWLMGVWERSPAGVAIANQNKSLLEDFRRALPDFRIEDNVGSPYCVRRYVVDQHLGGTQGLAIARRELSKRGVNLVLDFVPNRVAPDHPWATEHPEYFIRGNSDDIRNGPSSYIGVCGRVCACGRDPYFPAWPDGLQLSAFEPGLRQAVIETISEPHFRTHLGRPCWATPGNGVLVGCDLGHQEQVSRISVYRRGLLGPGMGTPATGLRLLLRQKTLRSAGTQQCREHPPSSVCRSCVPRKTTSVHREPRRAPGSGDIFTREA